MNSINKYDRNWCCNLTYRRNVKSQRRVTGITVFRLRTDLLLNEMKMKFHTVNLHTVQFSEWPEIYTPFYIKKQPCSKLNTSPIWQLNSVAWDVSLSLLFLHVLKGCEQKFRNTFQYNAVHYNNPTTHRSQSTKQKLNSSHLFEQFFFFMASQCIQQNPLFRRSDCLFLYIRQNKGKHWSTWQLNRVLSAE